MQFDIISIRNIQISYSYFIAACKLFSCGSKPIHALLAPKRRLIDLLKVLFKTLTNALLKSNKAPFTLLLYN